VNRIVEPLLIACWTEAPPVGSPWRRSLAARGPLASGYPQLTQATITLIIEARGHAIGEVGAH
jgi:hypothetical protein